MGDSLEEMKAAGRMAKYKSFLHPPNLCRVSAMCEALCCGEREIILITQLMFYNDHVAFTAVISLVTKQGLRRGGIGWLDSRKIFRGSAR